ncbi:MAG: acyltransferase [Flavobacteriales bacterium CG_4_9_14_3_um_filter_40_17]|nr:MAG: acyltransferase [Flavobacteriales bacterium CG_4_9_14_3_um_filter_40_17]
MQINQVSTKPHYLILDGLRGVAAVWVVAFHLFEAHATNHLNLILNHGYLAVDFFFVLSGFVIGYAYDDRWNKMSLKSFFKRRLIRLHPMIILGMTVGAVCFYFQAGQEWQRIIDVPPWKMLLVMLIGFTLLPIPKSMDIRGWQEMYPLNGPAWTLFFEYIANILYAVFIRKFSNKVLGILVVIAGALLLHMAVTAPAGDVIGGWSLESTQFRIGLTRLMYPFFAGLLLSRLMKPTGIKNAFLLCSILILIILSMPRIGGSDYLWLNGLYDALSIIALFPLIVYLGANGEVKQKFATKLCKFLGDISYPLYITHYPFIYIYIAWVRDNDIPLKKAWPAGLFVLLVCISLSYAYLKLYDEPVRKWLGKHLILKEVKK